MPRSPVEKSSEHPIYQRRDSYANITGKNERLAASFVIEHYITLTESEAKAVEQGEKLRRFIKGITIEEDEKMATKLILDMSNPDFMVTTTSRGQLGTRSLIQEGDQVVVQLGYGNERTTNSSRFIIMRIVPDFPKEGIPTVSVEGIDGRYLLISKDFIPKKRAENVVVGQLAKGAGKVPTVWKNKYDHEIIDGIAYHYGFAIDVDQTKGRRTRVKRKGTSNWEFILQLAKHNNFTAWVDWSADNKRWVLHFRKKVEQFDHGYEFKYESGSGGTLLSFRPRRDLFSQTTDIQVIHFDKRVKKVHTIYGSQKNIPGLPPLPNDPDDSTIIEGTYLKFEAEGRTIETYTMTPFNSKKDAEKYIRRVFRDRMADFMVADGTVVGTENLRPRQIHYITGVDIFSGTYYFTQARHLFRDGIYETDFVAYRVTSLQDLIKYGDVMTRSGGQ